jgi:hypothetical protein
MGRLFPATRAFVPTFTVRPMTPSVCRIIAAFLLLVPALGAQSSSRPPIINTSLDDIFRLGMFEYPPSSVYRDASGHPGPQYWQQKADYDIRATLDTGANTVSGTVTIRYTNNSPTPLTFVWIQLEQNYFSDKTVDHEARGRWPLTNQYGFTLSHVSVDGATVEPYVNGTVAKLNLPTKVKPKGGIATIRMTFRFMVPPIGGRMGRGGTSYFLAQWYPKMAVFDDVRGWNADQYYGNEFYLEYGDFTYALTVPAGYTVAGSGEMTNAVEVLTATQRARLARARADTAIVHIVTKEEATAQSTRRVPGTKTWKFVAKNVRDVAIIASPDLTWDATSWQGILCQALYPMRAGSDWTHGAEQTRWTIQFYSERLGKYPYPQITSVGTEPGMEYPMVGSSGTGAHDTTFDANFLIVNHEAGGHQYFPMIVGSNERRFGWMDEGFNNFFNEFALADRARDVGQRPKTFGASADVPSLMTHYDVSIMTANYFGGGALHSYSHPAAALFVLRNQVVGRMEFDLAFREYYDRWKFKHPTPGDFFRTMENVTGQDLGWFWRGFFYSNDVLDIGIDSVFEGRSMFASGDGAPPPKVFSYVRLRRHTSIPFPVTVRVKFADGTTRDVHVQVNLLSKPTYDLGVPSNSKIVGVRLWPNQVRLPAADSVRFPNGVWGIGDVPDVNAANDTWGDAPSATRSTMAPTDGGLTRRR